MQTCDAWSPRSASRGSSCLLRWTTQPYSLPGGRLGYWRTTLGKPSRKKTCLYLDIVQIVWGTFFSAWIWTFSKRGGGRLTPIQTLLRHFSAWIGILWRKKTGNFLGLKKVPRRCPRKRGGGGQGDLDKAIWSRFENMVFSASSGPISNFKTSKWGIIWFCIHHQTP